jgi:hypothetical protein
MKRRTGPKHRRLSPVEGVIASYSDPGALVGNDNQARPPAPQKKCR